MPINATTSPPAQQRQPQPDGALTAPAAGCVDLQVNGHGGVDFSALTLSVDGVRRATRALTDQGTLAYCPTVITAPLEVYRHNLPVLAAAMAAPDLARHLPGVHLEGPFISPHEGARGAHPLAHVQLPSIALFDEFWDLAQGRIKLLTVAPEQPGAAALIEHAAARGVVVCIGHTQADAATLEAAVAAGARLSTHLGNAYPAQCHPRDNAVWWQLACDRLSASFITDGHHLPVPFIITALRAKGVDRFIVVSDAAPITGLPPGDYETMGVPARLEPSGRVSLRGSRDTLAGSGSTMRACMAHLASLGLLTPAELRRVSVENPLQLLGLAPAAVGAPPVC